MLDHLGENVETPEQAPRPRDAYLAALAAIAREPDARLSRSRSSSRSSGWTSRSTTCLAQRRADPRRGRRAGDARDDRHGEPRVRGPHARGRPRRVHARSPAGRRRACSRTCAAPSDDVFDLPAGHARPAGEGRPTSSRPRSCSRTSGGGRELPRGCSPRCSPADTRSTSPRTIPGLIEGVRTLVERVEDGWSRVEFQMLYGVRRDLQARPCAAGVPGSGLHPVRHRVVPVPHATARRAAREHVVLPVEPGEERR